MPVSASLWFSTLYYTDILEPLEKQDGALLRCDPQITILLCLKRKNTYPDFAELRFDAQQINHPFKPCSHCTYLPDSGLSILFHPVFENSSVGAVVKQIECPLHPLTCIHVCWQRDLWLKPPCLVYFPQPQIGCSHVQVTHGGRLISRYAVRPPLNCAACNSFACSVSLARNYGLEHWMMAINRHTGLFRSNINIYPDSFPLLASLAFSASQTQW